jgi:hypothetical protein
VQELVPVPQLESVGIAKVAEIKDLQRLVALGEKAIEALVI